MGCRSATPEVLALPDRVGHPGEPFEEGLGIADVRVTPTEQFPAPFLRRGCAAAIVPARALGEGGLPQVEVALVIAWWPGQVFADVVVPQPGGIEDLEACCSATADASREVAVRRVCVEVGNPVRGEPETAQVALRA